MAQDAAAETTTENAAPAEGESPSEPATAENVNEADTATEIPQAPDDTKPEDENGEQQETQKKDDLAQRLQKLALERQKVRKNYNQPSIQLFSIYLQI